MQPRMGISYPMHTTEIPISTFLVKHKQQIEKTKYKTLTITLLFILHRNNIPIPLF